MGKLLYGIALVLSVYFHTSLMVMGAAVAGANLVAALLQVVAWKKLASQVRVTLFGVDRRMLKQMLAYCVVLSIWSVCMLLISGIDLAIVGHYDFAQVAFYSIATSPTTFLLMLVGAVLGPLLPASSALSTERPHSRWESFCYERHAMPQLFFLPSGFP